MNIKNKNSIRYKYLSFNELVINLDRLSRFKLPEDTFPRVFYEIIAKCLISPKYSKTEINNLDAKYISKIIQLIWNDSVNQNCKYNIQHKNNLLKIHIYNTFKNIDKRTETFINTKLNILPILKEIDYSSAPYNLKFLIKLSEYDDFSKINQKKIRENFSLKFPIEKLLIVEGITEEILLPVFANKINKDFDKFGVYVLGAGGKSKSPSLYAILKDKIKIPIILLFDSDAKEINEMLQKILLDKDSSIIIQQGEFEDILSKNLIKRALNNEYKPITPILKNELNINSKMCECIENFYKTRHLGEYKKSKVSKIIAQNIKYDTDISTDVKDLINNII